MKHRKRISASGHPVPLTVPPARRRAAGGPGATTAGPNRPGKITGSSLAQPQWLRVRGLPRPKRRPTSGSSYRFPRPQVLPSRRLRPPYRPEAMVRTLRTPSPPPQSRTRFMLTRARRSARPPPSLKTHRPALNASVDAGGPTVPTLARRDNCKAITEGPPCRRDRAWTLTRGTVSTNVARADRGSAYRPFSARYKVDIIDEVHCCRRMRSTRSSIRWKTAAARELFLFATPRSARFPVTG